MDWQALDVCVCVCVCWAFKITQAKKSLVGFKACSYTFPAPTPLIMTESNIVITHLNQTPPPPPKETERKKHTHTLLTLHVQTVCYAWSLVACSKVV